MYEVQRRYDAIFVRELANKCPEELATSNARAILMKLFHEEIAECPEELTTRKLQLKPSVNNVNGDYSYLGDNYPDPAKDNTKIDYFLPEGEGIIEITDIFGRKMDWYNMQLGENTLEIDLGKYSQGMYFYAMYIDGLLIDKKKLVVTK